MSKKNLWMVFILCLFIAVSFVKVDYVFAQQDVVQAGTQANEESVGKVVAKGTLKLCHCSDTKDIECSKCDYDYIIIQVENDGGFITQYSHRPNIRFQSGIEIEDKVILIIRDNWSAEWRKYDYSYPNSGKQWTKEDWS